jgi:hypothetical protein
VARSAQYELPVELHFDTSAGSAQRRLTSINSAHRNAANPQPRPVIIYYSNCIGFIWRAGCETSNE